MLALAPTFAIGVDAWVTALAAGAGLRVTAAPAVIGHEPADVVLEPVAAS